MTLIRRAILALVLMAGFTPAFAQAPAAVPPLPDTERRVSYALTASTCACSIPFALYGEGTDYANWIEVWLNGTRIDQFGNWSITSPSGSIGTLARPITNGVLTFNSAQTGTVQIVGARRPRRISQFSESAGVSARNLNQAFTDIVAQNRETWDKINDVTGRVIMAPPGESLSVLASAASRANSVLGFDALGNIATYNPASAVTAASNVNFLQTGTGAVSRTVQLELQDTIKATQFGAVCDGITDDAPAVQRAVDEADRLNSGRTVELCAGTSRWNTTVYLNKWAPVGNTLTVPGLKIKGQGKDVTIIDSRVANGYAIAVNPAWHGAFKSQYNMVAVASGGSLGTSVPLGTLGAITGGTLYTNGTYSGVALTGGAGSGATANITVSGGSVTAVTVVNPGTGYTIGNTLSATAASIGGTGSGFSVPFASVTWYMQPTMNNGLGDEVFIALPKPVTITTAAGGIDVPLEATNNGYSYNLYCSVAPTTQPVNYCNISAGTAVAVGGAQTVRIISLGVAHTVPTAKRAIWQNADVSNLTITNTTAAAGASGLLYFKAGYANVSNVFFKNLTGNGFDTPNYAGDLDGSFVVTVDKSKFDTIAGWCINAAGFSLESSNFSVLSSAFNFCGTLPSGFTQAQNYASSGLTVTSATNANPGVFTTATHNFLNNDQVWLRSVAGMTLADGWYRINLLSPTTFNLRTLDGALIDTTALGAYTASSGRVMLAWRPPTTTSGSGAISWMGLIGTFKNLGFTQNYNTSMYFSEGGTSDNTTIEAVDFENTYGKALYVASLVGGKMINSECLSTAALGPTISCVQLGTGASSGGVSNFQIENIKVRSDVTPTVAFEQFRNTSFTTPSTDTNRVRNVSWQTFDSAGQTRFTGFNFDPIPGTAKFSISALNTAQLIPIGVGATVPMKLKATGEWIAYQVPQAGITLGSLSGTPATLYYFYLYNSSAGPLFPIVPTIEQSLGGPVLDASGGYYVKSGDSTRTLIGTATTDGAGAFQIAGVQTSQYPPSAPVSIGSVTGLGTGVATALAVNVGTAGSIIVRGSAADLGTLNVTSTAAPCFAVGRNGATNPVLQADCSTPSAVAGLKVVGTTAGGTVRLTTTDSGANNNLAINALGTGTITLGDLSTGAVTINNGLTLPTQLTVANGGTGRNTLTNHGLLVGAATTAITQMSVGTTGQLLFGVTGADPAWTSTGTGVPTALGIAVNANGSVITNGSGAILQASPADPTGATTEVMMGLGSTCTITPVQSTRVHLNFQGEAQNATGGGVVSVQARYGTGAAPANAAALTGTTLGSKPHSLQNTANEAVMFRAGGNITGLTRGTAYWFDLAVSNVGTGTTATVNNISCDAFEIP